jgi:hypothetical protein
MECTPYFSPRAVAPSYLDPCVWLHYIQFNGIMVGVVLALGLLAIIGFIIYYFLVRNKQVTVELQLPMFIVIALLSIFAFCLLVGTILATVPAVQTIPNAIDTAHEVEIRFPIVANNLTNLLASFPLVNASFWPFIRTVVTARDAAQIVRTRQGPIDVQLRDIKDDVFDHVLPRVINLMAENDRVKSILNVSLNLENVIDLPFNLNEMVPLKRTFMAVNDSLVPLWFNHVMAGEKMQALLDDLKSGTAKMTDVVEKSLLNLPKTYDIMHGLIDNLISTSQNATTLIERGLDQKIPPVFITTTAVVSILSIALIMSTCFIPIILYKKISEKSSTRGISDCSFGIGGLFLIIFVIVFAGYLFSFMTTLPYCMKGNNIINPRDAPQSFRDENKHYVEVLELTYQLTQCHVNGTMLDAALAVYEDLRTNSVFNPQFSADLETGLHNLEPLLAHALAFKAFSEKVIQFSTKFNTSLDLLNDATLELDLILHHNLLDRIDNLTLYEKDNHISFDTFNGLIENVNNITDKIGEFYTPDTIDELTPEICKDPRFTASEQQRLLAYHDQLAPIIVIYKQIISLQKNVNNWEFAQHKAIRTIVDTISMNKKGMARLHVLEEELQYPYGKNLSDALYNIDKKEFIKQVFALKARKESTTKQSKCEYIGKFASDAESMVCTVVFPGVVVSFVSSGLIVLFLGIMMALSVLLRNYDLTFDPERLRLIVNN